MKMNSEYPEIRQTMAEQGYEMTDEQYGVIIGYARHKAENAGKDETYLTYLLPDVIREWFIQKAINGFTMGMMELERRAKEAKESGTAAITTAARTGKDSIHTGMDR